MPNELTDRRVAFLTAMEGVEQAELTSPWQAVLDAGGTPELLAPEPGKVQAFNHLDRAGTFDVTATIAVEAGLVCDRTLTSWPSLQTDIRNAGGTWVDAQVRVCTAGPNVLITSRKPDDLPAFCDALVTQFSQARPA